MTLFKLDLVDGKDTTYKSQLGTSGVYKLRVYWNEEAEVWLLDMSQVDNTPIFYSQTLIQDFELFKPHRHLGTPKGMLAIVDNGDDSSVIREITRDNISDFQLYYTEV